jgi:ankyrin repeat protein
VELGADIDSVKNSLLSIACKNEFASHYELINYLLDKGADANIRDSYGNTLLAYITPNGSDVFKRIKEKSTDLFALAYRGSPEDIQNVLKNGADINEAITNGKTPIFYAAFNLDNTKTLEFMIKSGAKVNVSTINGTTPFEVAFLEGQPISNLKLMLEGGADINQIIRKDLDKDYNFRLYDSYDATFLLYSIRWAKNPDLVKFLIKQGITLNIRDAHGKTALDYALASSYWSANKEVMALLGAKTDVLE